MSCSQRYPCRDPFFKMLTRSLATFMNAYTATDYTLYPFSTINPTDYKNLMGVYLDAAFFPLLSKHVCAVLSSPLMRSCTIA